MNKHSHFLIFFIFSAVFFSSLQAANPCENSLEIEDCQTFTNHQLINQISVGPEVYWAKRTRSRSQLTGTMGGIRVGYDRIKRYGWYIGGEALYAGGELKGKTKSKEKLNADCIDTTLEGRFGYTFQQKNSGNIYFTPFAGYGYFVEKVNFKKPTPIPYHNKNSFSYIPVGFLSHIYIDWIDSSLGIGLNFTARYLTASKVSITNDPRENIGKVTQHYTEEIQYRFELPITYDLTFQSRLWQVRLEPFYEYRNYGAFFGKYDFVKTKFTIYGANLQLIYLF